MSLIQCKYYSESLKMTTDIEIVLPTFSLDVPAPKFPVLFMLHGFTGDSSTWIRHTGIERYAKAHNLAVVMPCAYNSAYTDMHYGQKYFTYISQELPKFIRAVFPISEKKEDTFVAGESMGGYGALKWALTNPEFFAAVGSFSGSLHVEDRLKGKSANSGNQCVGIYGDPPKILQDTQDLFVMLKTLKEQGAAVPKLFICCGTEDREHIYGAYKDFKEFAAKINVDITAEDSNGEHNFEYWDPMLRRFLDWLPLKKSMSDN